MVDISVNFRWLQNIQSSESFGGNGVISRMKTPDMGTGKVLLRVGFTGSDSILVMEPMRMNMTYTGKWAGRKGILETTCLVFFFQ